MDIAGYVGEGNDVTVDFLMQEAREQDEVTSVANISADCVMTPDAVELDFVGERHVPQLFVSGVVDKIMVRDASKADMPYGVESVTFPHDQRPRIESYYTFTTEQLMALVDKGLYAEGFAPPREWMQSVQWEIPAKVNIDVVPAEYEGEIIPIVAADIQDRHYLEMNQRTSGYNLAEIFPNRRKELEAQGRYKEGAAVDLGQSYDGAQFDDVFHEPTVTQEKTLDEAVLERQRADALAVSGLGRINQMEQRLGIESSFAHDVEQLGAVTADSVLNIWDASEEEPAADAETVAMQEVAYEQEDAPEVPEQASVVEQQPSSRQALLDSLFASGDGASNGDALGVGDVIGMRDEVGDTEFDALDIPAEELLAQRRAREHARKERMRIKRETVEAMNTQENTVATSAPSDFVDFEDFDQGPEL